MKNQQNFAVRFWVLFLEATAKKLHHIHETTSLKLVQNGVPSSYALIYE